MPYLEFNVHRGSPLTPCRHLVFAELATASPSAFHAILATGAVHLASLRGCRDSPAATYHVAQSLRLLRKSMQVHSNPAAISGLVHNGNGIDCNRSETLSSQLMLLARLKC